MWMVVVGSGGRILTRLKSDVFGVVLKERQKGKVLQQESHDF